jgi:hypothetical protein
VQLVDRNLDDLQIRGDCCLLWHVPSLGLLEGIKKDAPPKGRSVLIRVASGEIIRSGVLPEALVSPLA